MIDAALPDSLEGFRLQAIGILTGDLIPIVDRDIRIAAPFGWTGALRMLCRDVGALLRDAASSRRVRLKTLLLAPSGVQIDVRGSDADLRSLLHLAAHNAAAAALGVSPVTGLPTPWALQQLDILLRSDPFPTEAPQQLATFLPAIRAMDPPAREKLHQDISRLQDTRDLVGKRDVRTLRNWRLVFPDGFTSVALSGVQHDSAGTKFGPCPLLMIDDFRRWARTTDGLSRMVRSESPAYDRGFL